MDNYLESYHVPVGHPGLFRLVTPDFEDQRAVPGVARGVGWIRERPSSRWSERMYQQLIGPSPQHLPEAESALLARLQHAAEPRHRRHAGPDRFLPGAAERPRQDHHPRRTLGLPDSRREMRIARYLTDRINRQTNREDAWLCERVQRGLQSSSYVPGRLSTLERWMLEFHDLLRERIPEVRLATRAGALRLKDSPTGRRRQRPGMAYLLPTR